MDRVERLFVQRRESSRRWYERARKVIPGGVTHDLRNLKPFPLYVNQARGARKWDVDGNEYIDYWLGHGSLILGHLHPATVEAVQAQIEKGTHYGACSELEVLWAEKIVEMVPSAQKVRFVSSGTEATLMAIKLARAHTGKSKIVKFEGHFHGWHDQVSIGVIPPFDAPTSPEIPRAIRENTIAVPPDNLEVLASVLERDKEIAGVMMEPTGGSTGTYPMFGEALRNIRELTQQHGVMLIFDEVITGFRVSTGGAQKFFGVHPDITCLGKIMCGGLPGAAVVGGHEIMERLEAKGDAHRDRHKKIRHFGTQNASPLSAAAGLATLNTIDQGDVIPRVDALATRLRKGLNDVLAQHALHSCVYGSSSVFHTFFNHDCPKRGCCDYERCDYDYRKIYSRDAVLVQRLWNALANRGVDSMVVHGTVSFAHTEEDIEQTITAFDSAMGEMKALGLVS